MMASQRRLSSMIFLRIIWARAAVRTAGEAASGAALRLRRGFGAVLFISRTANRRTTERRTVVMTGSRRRPGPCGPRRRHTLDWRLRQRRASLGTLGVAEDAAGRGPPEQPGGVQAAVRTRTESDERPEWLAGDHDRTILGSGYGSRHLAGGAKKGAAGAVQPGEGALRQ